MSEVELTDFQNRVSAVVNQPFDPENEPQWTRHLKAFRLYRFLLGEYSVTEYAEQAAKELGFHADFLLYCPDRSLATSEISGGCG